MASGTQTWTNWSGTYTVAPQVVRHPRDVGEVAEAVTAAARDDVSVKAVGSGHSFTDIAATRGMMLQLDQLHGVLSADRASGLVTVAAGTTLAELNRALWDLGLSMTNLGDIDVQTVSGALSTGTHGTGQRFGGLATQLRGLEIVTADGGLVRCSPTENPDIFDIARINLGALGVITAVTLQCEPAFALHADERPARYEEVLDSLDSLVGDNDHFEFYWFPHTRRVLTKANNRVPLADGLDPVGRFRGWLDDEFLSNTVYERINRLTTRRPRLIAPANRLAARALSARDYTDRSYRVFASPRRVVFREMEYAIGREHLAEVIHEIQAWLAHTGERVGFPVEVRFAAADDIPLSTAQGRDTCYVAVHEYHRRPYQTYFLAVEQIMRAVGGRPHWGKLHYRTAENLAPEYPRFDEFIAVRDRLDPDRRFGNDYLRRVLGS